MMACTRILGVIGLCGAAVACSPQSRTTSDTQDTGSMAYPQPLPAGNINTVRTGQVPGIPRDTGSMAYPQPLPAGDINTVRTRP